MRILLLNNEHYGSCASLGFRQLGHDVKIAGIIQVDYLRRYLEVLNDLLIRRVGLMSTRGEADDDKKAAQDVHCLHAYWRLRILSIWKMSIPMVKIVQPDLVFTINPMYSILSCFRDTAFHMEFGYNPLMETHPSKRPDADYNMTP